MKKTYALILLLGNISSVYAGVNGLTYHSRANCVGFNETVSWDLTHNWMLATDSRHDDNKSRHYHVVSERWRNTWRSAAYHATESYETNRWSVMGFHYIYVSGWPVYRTAQVETVMDCDKYDGWWDNNK